jgi:hypothetical protein
MMFGRKMFLEIETRCLVDAFGGCSAGIRRDREFFKFHQKKKIYLYVSLPNNLQTHQQRI